MKDEPSFEYDPDIGNAEEPSPELRHKKVAVFKPTKNSHKDALFGQSKRKPLLSGLSGEVQFQKSADVLNSNKQKTKNAKNKN